MKIYIYIMKDQNILKNSVCGIPELCKVHAVFIDQLCISFLLSRIGCTNLIQFCHSI